MFIQFDHDKPLQFESYVKKQIHLLLILIVNLHCLLLLFLSFKGSPKTKQLEKETS